MVSTKLNIGKIPISKGEYQEGTTYQRLNQVTMLGSTYQSKIDDNTSAPAQIGADGAVENINTDKWLCVAVGNVSAAKKVVYNNETSGLEAGNVQEAIDEVGSKVSDLSLAQTDFLDAFANFSHKFGTRNKHSIIVSELLDGYISNDGEVISHNNYKHTKKITLAKGECIYATVSGSEISIISQYIDETHYKPLVLSNTSRGTYYFYATKNIDISISGIFSEFSYYIIVSNDELVYFASKRTTALLIPYYRGVIDIDIDKSTITIPSNWGILYKDTPIFFSNEQVVSFNKSQSQSRLYYNIKENIFVVDFSTKSFDDNLVPVFDICVLNNIIVNLPISLYSINGKKPLEIINEKISSVENSVLNVEKAITDESPISYPITWMNGYYISDKGGKAVQYDNYSISTSIELKKGDRLVASVTGNGISTLSTSTNKVSSLDDISNSSFESLLTSDSSTGIEYSANKDCYVTLCSRSSDKPATYKLYRQKFYDIAQIKQDIKVLDERISLPTFVMEETLKTYKRYEQWKGKDKCCVFPIMTDLHPYLNDTIYDYIDYMINGDEIFGYNFIANLGDFGDNISYDADGVNVLTSGKEASLSKTEEIDYDIIRKTALRFGRWKGRLVFSQGNHDCVDNSSFADKTFGRETVWNYLMCPTINRFPKEYVVNNEHQCGYYDDSDNKIRFLFLNTSDNQKEDYNNGDTRKEYKITKEQLQWLVQSLSSIPNSYSVVVFAHFCINRIGEWKVYPQNNTNLKYWAYGSSRYVQGLGRILEGFANKTKGTDNESDNSYYNSNVSWDFTNIDSSSKLIAYICGDSHFDALLKKDEVFVTESGTDAVPIGISCPANGVNYLISQGYGGNNISNCHSKATYTSFVHDVKAQMLYDVVAIKPEKNEVKVFRVGAGGEERDREFSY